MQAQGLNVCTAVATTSLVLAPPSVKPRRPALDAAGWGPRCHSLHPQAPAGRTHRRMGMSGYGTLRTLQADEFAGVRRRQPSTILHATSSAAQTSDEEHSQAVTVDDEDDNEDHPALQGDDDEGQALPTQEWSLPEPTNVQVRSAQYVSSCVNVRDCPPPRLPEIAVIGRSNVGKSSLINLLTGNRKLAHVSKEPGKTRCINHFIINDAWYLVDLPGYGFAKTGFATREAFDRFTKEYFTNRRNLVVVYLLVDASIPPQKVDLEYAAWLRESNVPFAVVFTKADKRKRREPGQRENVGAFKAALLSEAGFTQVPPSVLTSSALGLGRGPLLRLTASLRQQFTSEGHLEAAMAAWNREQRLRDSQAAAARAAGGAGEQGRGARASDGSARKQGSGGAAAGGKGKAATGSSSAAGAPRDTFVASAALKARLARTTTTVGLQPGAQAQSHQHASASTQGSGGAGSPQAGRENASTDAQPQHQQEHVGLEAGQELTPLQEQQGQ